MKQVGALAAVAAIIVLSGCARGPLHTASPTFRQLRVGDTWKFQKMPNLNHSTLTFEVINAGAPDVQGMRSLTLRVHERYWGGLPGYKKGWQEKSCELPMQQAASGSLAFTELQPEGASSFDMSVFQFPPLLSCPMAAGQVGNTGVKPLPRGSESTTWKVVGQEEISTPLGRFRAWRVDGEQVSQGEDGKNYMKVQWTDWYDSERWLLRRHYKLADSNDSVLSALKALTEQRLEQVR